MNKNHYSSHGLRNCASSLHPRLRLRTSVAHPILIRTEIRRIRRSNATIAPFDPLRHPPQGVSVHSRNDGGDTSGRGQGPGMDPWLRSAAVMTVRLSSCLSNSTTLCSTALRSSLGRDQRYRHCHYDYGHLHSVVGDSVGRLAQSSYR